MTHHSLGLRRCEADAVERLVDLIREHGKWVEPEADTRVS